MAFASNCHIYYDLTDDTFCFVSTDYSHNTWYYNFDFHDYASGNDGWHGCSGWTYGGSGTSIYSSNARIYTSGSNYQNVSGQTVSFTARSNWISASTYSNISTLQGRVRIAQYSDGSDWNGYDWTYSPTITNPKYYVPTPKCPTPTGVMTYTSGHYIQCYADSASGYTTYYDRRYYDSNGNWYCPTHGSSCANYGWHGDYYYADVSSLSAYYKVQFRVRNQKDGYLDSDWAYSGYFIMPPTPSSCYWYVDGDYVRVSISGSDPNSVVRVDKRVNGGSWQGKDVLNGGELYHTITTLNVGDTVEFRARFYCTNGAFYTVGSSDEFGWAYSTVFTKSITAPTISFDESSQTTATLYIGYNNSIDHVYVYCNGNSYYHGDRTNAWITITGLTAGTLYSAYCIGYDSSGTHNATSNTVQFETTPYAPTLAPVSGYPTINEMRYTLTWGVGAYQTLVHLKKDGAVVQYWSSTTKTDTSVSFISLSAGTYTVEAWSETQYYGEISNKITLLFTVVNKPSPPTIGCGYVSGLTYEFSITRDSIGKTTHISIYDEAGNLVVDDYQNTSVSFTVNFTMVKYRNTHTYSVWVTNDVTTSDTISNNFTTPYAPKPVAYPSSYMEYYTGSVMTWYDVGHTKVVICTATEWNTLRNKVNEVKAYNQGYGNGGNYGFTYGAVTSGQTVTASIYNDMVGAFNSIGLYPSTVSTGQKINGSHFKTLKDLINSKISTL